MIRHRIVGCAAAAGIWGLLGLSLIACSPPVNIAGETLKGTTTGEAFEGVQCSAVRPQTEPDLMAWDPGSRANLNRLRGVGAVAVRYRTKGCNVELELLSNCIGAAKYQFSPYSAREQKVAHNASELFSQLPVGAAALSTNVKGGRALRTDYMLAGQYALPPDASFRSSDLRGAGCGRATHVVSSIYVGAFVMGAGESRAMDAKATLFGAGVQGDSKADVDVLKTEGDADACTVAQKEGKESYGCAVPLRIGLQALTDVIESVPPASAPIAPASSASGVMVRIAGGTFLMGLPGGDASFGQDPAHLVTLPGFEMDVTEVTTAAYSACVRSGKCTAASADNMGCNYGKSDKSNHPINCLDRGQAAMYCNAQGKRLPTNEEWEYAARGGSEARIYSWGKADPDFQLCWSGISRRDGTCAVASFARGVYGLADMNGNLEEWTLSRSQNGGQSQSGEARGGSFFDELPLHVRGVTRSELEPSYRGHTVGFRCVR